MTYVVTGATSCIGSAVAEYVLKHGGTVVATMRKGSAKESSFMRQFVSYADKLHVFYCDFADVETIKDEVACADIFFNFAWAGTSKEQRDSVELQARNVECALKAMRTAAALGCKVYVEAGSQAEYGWQDGTPTTEESPCAPFSEYGKAKLRVWQEGKALAESLGIAYVHLRIFSVYGETESDGAILPYCIRRSLLSAPIELSPCTQSWNFLYRRDAAEMISRLADCHYDSAPACEVYNIAGCDTRELKQFVEEMAAVIGTRSELCFGAVQPPRLLSLAPSIDKTLRAIGGMTFTPFAEGVTNECNYLKGL